MPNEIYYDSIDVFLAYLKAFLQLQRLSGIDWDMVRWLWLILKLF